MSAATAGLVPAATLGFTQTSPCFVFPLTDRATNLEESSLLKVCQSNLMLPGLNETVVCSHHRSVQQDALHPLHTGNRARVRSKVPGIPWSKSNTSRSRPCSQGAALDSGLLADEAQGLL
jgi:hypothetical protein